MLQCDPALTLEGSIAALTIVDMNKLDPRKPIVVWDLEASHSFILHDQLTFGDHKHCIV